MNDVERLLPEIAWIGDERLRTAVRDIWTECWEQSSWPDLATVPKSTTSGADRTLITHTRSVTGLAVQTARTMAELHGIGFDHDVLVAGALLHDVSKLAENEPGDPSSYSRSGRLIQHGVYGAFKAWQKDLPVELVHAIIVHTRGSRVLPQTHEAMIIHYVDYLDSDCVSLRDGQPLLLARD